MLQACQLVVGQDGESTSTWRALSGPGTSKLPPGPISVSSRHQFLTDSVERRVGDLGEELLEIVEEQLRRSDSTAKGVSFPIEPIGSSALHRHRPDQQPQLLVGVPKACWSWRREGPPFVGAEFILRPVRALIRVHGWR